MSLQNTSTQRPVAKRSSDATACPECDGIVRPDGKESVCQQCGLVVDEHRIDHGPDWRHNREAGSTEKRTGGPLTATRHDRGLSTEIGTGRDANGNPLSSKKRRQLGRLRREHKRGRFDSTAERNLATGLSEVRRIVSTLELSESVREQACQLFRTAQSDGLLKGRSIERIAAASVYATCRTNRTPRTLEDVADPARVDPETLQGAYNTLNTELGLPTPPRPPIAFVPQLASNLEVSDDVRTSARTLATRADEANIAVGCNPSAFAGACLYRAAREHNYRLAQTEVAAVAATCAQTIRTHLHRLDTLDDA